MRTALPGCGLPDVIYPEYCSRLTFWCLYGHSYENKEGETHIIFKTSNDIIQTLNEAKNSNNDHKIEEIIRKIQNLKNNEIIEVEKNKRTLEDYFA